ncbi:unnamed protein product, partial [Urochloa humidicola]
VRSPAALLPPQRRTSLPGAALRTSPPLRPTPHLPSLPGDPSHLLLCLRSTPPLRSLLTGDERSNGGVRCCGGMDRAKSCIDGNHRREMNHIILLWSLTRKY